LISIIINLFDKKYYSLTVIYFLENSLSQKPDIHTATAIPAITVSVALKIFFITDLLKKNVKNIITLLMEIFHNIRKIFYF